MGRVVIIGAGLAGLTAARLLSEASPGTDLVVIDEGRRVGGRLATRRMGRATVDHGAQFFTVRSETFREVVDGWLAAGVVQEWCRGFATEDGYPRYRAVGGMSALAKHLARDLPVVMGHRANAVIPGPDRWAVAYEAARREPDQADAVIATPPVPQTLELLAAGATVLGPEMARTLAGVSYHRVIAVLARLDRSPELPPPGALQQPDHPVFSFVADNQAKGISDEPAMTFHLAHPLSAELWDHDDAAILARIDDELRRLLGPAEAEEIQVRRWPYAGPVEPHPERFLVAADRPGPLVLAGDAFNGPAVEGAFLSGRAAAAQVASTLARG